MTTFLLLITPDLRIVLAEEGEASGVILDRVEADSWLEAKVDLGLPFTDRDELWLTRPPIDKDLW